MGSYPITQGTLTAGANYTISYSAGTLSVTPAPLSVTADGLSKVYGAALPALDLHLLRPGQRRHLVGVHRRLIDHGDRRLRGRQLPDHSGHALRRRELHDQLQRRDTERDPGAAAVTADSPSKVYGAPIPALSYTYSGLVNGDTSSVFTGTLSTAATAASGVGAYAHRQGTLTAGANYTISYSAGTLSVTPAPLSVTADSPSKVYGAALPALSFTLPDWSTATPPSVFTGALDAPRRPLARGSAPTRSLRARSRRRQLHDQLQRRDAERHPGAADGDGRQPEQGLRRGLPALSYTYRPGQRRHAAVFTGTLEHHGDRRLAASAPTRSLRGRSPPAPTTRSASAPGR